MRLSITSYLQSRLEQVVKYPLPRLLSDTNWTGLSYQLSLLSLTLLQQFKKFIERFFLCRINFRKHWNLVTLLAVIFNLCYKQNKTNYCEFKLNSKKKQSFTTIGHSGLVWEGAPELLILVVRFKTGNQWYNDKYPITCLDNSFEGFLHFISTIFISSFDTFLLQVSFHLFCPFQFFAAFARLSWDKVKWDHVTSKHSVSFHLTVAVSGGRAFFFLHIFTVFRKLTNISM